MISSDYLYTSLFASISELSLDNNSIYFYGLSQEERSSAATTLEKSQLYKTKFLKIEEIDHNTIYISDKSRNYLLRNSNDITEMLLSYSASTIYLDVTALDNRICASLLKNALRLSSSSNNLLVKTIYVEPESYNMLQFKSEGVFNDLSEKIDGISPLPGFATIFPDDIDNFTLVALLGFEGGRFSHIIENIQPPKDNIIPVIGVPGFRIEYPNYAYQGNMRPLSETGSWRRIKYAAANSLVEVYLLVNKMIAKKSFGRIKLAPIGTKPHAIAAILSAIKHPNTIELVYDNPKRKKRRTQGFGKVTECFVSKLIAES